MRPTPSSVPDLERLRVGAPAHGGHCVARGPDGRIVFVRHALPGELVLARITEQAGSFWLADAVEVLEPSPDRVAPPCPHAGPGRCGGCDWQHASGPAQRGIKAAVVREQLARLARLDVPVTVEELPGGLLGWRSRIQWAITADGTLGLRRHRSHDVEPIEFCPLGAPGVGNPPAPRPGLTGVEVVRGDDGRLSDGILNLETGNASPLAALLPSAWRATPAFWHGPAKLDLHAAGPPEAVAVSAQVTLGDAHLEARPTVDLRSGRAARLSPWRCRPRRSPTPRRTWPSCRRRE